MNNHFKRRRFYSEKLSTDVTRRGNKDNPIIDFTLPDSPKISNLELIEEVDDFKLDNGDIFSDFLGLEEPIDKASFFEQFMKTGQDNQEDSFELEIASREQEKPNQKESESPHKNNQKDLLLELNDFPFLEENNCKGQKIPHEKNADLETKINSGGKYELYSIQNKKFEINCPSKKKMINEIFSFKVDVGKTASGNRNRSQSYSIGQTNSIFDFLNKK